MQKNCDGLDTLLRPQISDLTDKYQGVIVAASGGLDSTVLFHVLLQLANEKKNFRLAICHMNFCLRGEASEQEQRFLEDLAAQAGIPIFARRAGGEPKLGRESTQVWARRIRYRFFEELAADGWAIALAHTMDDVAESIILRLARGVSAAAMLGMRTWHGPYWRPFLEVRKGTLAEWANRHNLQHCHDESNDKMTYARNVVRHKVLPVLEELYPQASRRIARTGKELQDLVQIAGGSMVSTVEAAIATGALPTAKIAELNYGGGIHLVGQWLRAAELTAHASVLEKICAAARRQEKAVFMLSPTMAVHVDKMRARILPVPANKRSSNV